MFTSSAPGLDWERGFCFRGINCPAASGWGIREGFINNRLGKALKWHFHLKIWDRLR